MEPKERRWMLLAEAGRHSWLGRDTDPTAVEIASLEDQLTRARLGGWITVVDGRYWRDVDLHLLEVRKLFEPGCTCEEAVAEFLRLREIAKSQ